MAESQDALLLRKRARRRLIGAIALVLFIVIVLPMVLDKEPKLVQNEIAVQIPSQDSGNFNTRVLPPPAAKSVDEPGGTAKIVPQSETKPAPKAETKPAAKSREKASSTPVTTAKAEQARAQAILDGDTWVVTLGTFSKPDNIKQLQAKLSAAKVKSYTEPVKTASGEQQTRVRAGPFKTKAQAEKTRDKLKAAGITDGIVTTR